MNIQTPLLALIAIVAAAHTSISAQTVRLTFDPGQIDYGAFETSGTDTELTLTRSGGSVATNDFSELDGLTAETYSINGASLGSASPVGFTISTTGGVANIDGTALDIAGSGIDSGESITFIFDTNILITEFDLAAIDLTQLAEITIGGSIQTFGDSVGDVHSGSFSLNAGQSLIFGFNETNGADYDIQAFTFTAVPEPNTYALLSGCCALGFAMLRRRKQ
jgi:hypothetical protein